MFQESDPDVVAGIEIIASVCEAPLRTIVANTGASADVVVEKLIESSGDHKIFYVDVANVEPEDLVNFVSSYRIAKKTELEKGEETKFRYGYNAATGKYGDLVTQGIIDPVKVTRYALEHAASVIGLVLTCNSVVVNEEKKE
jgi:chaperonin GroEL